jgi:hypothetical protein
MAATATVNLSWALKLREGLEKVVPNRSWKASPAMRMMELLYAAGACLGLVTNGGQWVLIYARRGETTAFVSWYADLWLEEPLTLRAFHSLLDAQRFFGVPEDETLPALLEAARRLPAFHWPFEFPEVFEEGGFSGFVGNPPFLGGMRISHHCSG